MAVDSIKTPLFVVGDVRCYLSSTTELPWTLARNVPCACPFSSPTHSTACNIDGFDKLRTYTIP